jgi:tRNA A-37 threonylcarbamoyl transferase component Bud32
VFENSDPSLWHNREFSRVKAGGFAWWVRRASLDDRLQKVLDNPDGYLPDVTNLPLTLRPSTSVSRVSNFFLKRYNRARPTKLLKSIFRCAPAQRAFDLACDLERVGILTPRALAVANKRLARVLLRSYLVTENIEEAKTLDQWQGHRGQAARQVAALVARLHDAGFIHRDLNPTNVLFNQLNQLLFVDLDTMRRVRLVPEYLAMDDVARFSRKALLCSKILLSDRVRFLKEYCRLRGVAGWRSWWKQIDHFNLIEYERLARKSKSPSRFLAIC